MRLRLTQAGLSKLLGVGRLLVLRHETGDRCPDAEYLLKLKDIGFDIYFVLTGEPATEQIDFICMEKAVIFLLEMARELNGSVDKKTMTMALIHFYRSALAERRDQAAVSENEQLDQLESDLN